MDGDLPAYLEVADARARTFPASWRDAAIRILYDRAAGGVRCALCGGLHRRPAELKRLQGDHVEPWSRGGPTTWANLQLLCPACNLKKQAKPSPAPARPTSHTPGTTATPSSPPADVSEL